jgi:hypothetical protein
MGKNDPAVELALLQEQKVKACLSEINTALEKHGCILDVQVVLTMHGNRFTINVVPKPNTIVPPPAAGKPN